MRYLVKAKLKKGKGARLRVSIENETLGKGSVAGDEYLHDMKKARLLENGLAEWIEVCFCAVPLEEEKPYWEEYFDLIEIAEAAKRKGCRHETGKEFWSCIDCRCTKKKERELNEKGVSFLNELNNFSFNF